MCELQFRIDRLQKQDRENFSCGVAELDDYLRTRSGQDVRKKLTACYLLINDQTEEIAGYYTLSSGGMAFGDLPASLSKNLPKYSQIPIARIGRLAVATKYQGKKLGGVLITDAIKQALKSGFGVYAMVVDSKDDNSTSFYQHLGFIKQESNPQILFLPLKDAVKNLAKQ